MMHWPEGPVQVTVDVLEQRIVERDNIGVRLTGDVSDLQRALGQGGAAVEQFSRKGQADLDGFGKAADSAGKRALSLQDILSVFGMREAIRFGWKAMTGDLTQFEGAMVSAQTATSSG